MPGRSCYNFYKIICGYLLFFYAVSALTVDAEECVMSADDSACASIDFIGPSTLCMSIVTGTLASLNLLLPSSRQMFAELYSTPGFGVDCVDTENIVATRDLHEDTAYYNTKNNKIYLPVGNEVIKKLRLESPLHHEGIHALTNNRHQSPHCNLSIFSRRELATLTTDNAGNSILLPYSPIWPPTKRNLDFLTSIIQEDLALPWYAQAVKLNKKIFASEKLSPREKEELNLLNLSLKGILLPPGRIKLGEPRESKIEYTATAWQLSGNVIFTRLQSVQLAYGMFQVTGEISDDISSILYRVQFALMAYQENINKGLHAVAVAEFDAHLRTGLPDEHVKVFFPGLIDQIERDVSCCTKGIGCARRS